MESLFSFPVGLLHSLQHAGLSRRSPVSRLTGSYHDILVGCWSFNGFLFRQSHAAEKTSKPGIGMKSVEI
jgi:hypothetical protein